MKSWLRGVALAAVFALAGAFATSLWLELRRETPAAAPEGTWVDRRIRVEVLNGAGVEGLAWRATERLRDLRFDVVYVGNAESFDHDTSRAVARIEDAEPARRVADALGLRKVVSEPDRDLYLDVTVVLGKDWAESGPRERRETPVLQRWWRRIIRALARLVPG